MIRNSHFPKAMSEKAKELKPKITDEQMMTIQRHILKTWIDKDDEDELASNCKIYREMLRKFNFNDEERRKAIHQRQP